MGKFKIKVTTKKKPEGWWEDYDKLEITNQDEAQAWAIATIKWFNDGLRQGEEARKLREVEFLTTESDQHDWHKTNLVTIVPAGDGDAYDTLKCQGCGITAKRYGMSTVVLDRRYRKAKVYESCTRTKDHLKRMAERRRMRG